MPTDLFSEFHDLRAAIEAQIALFGRTVPRPADAGTTDDTGPAAIQPAESGPATETEPATAEPSDTGPAAESRPSETESAAASEAPQPETHPESAPESVPEPTYEPDAATETLSPWDRIADLIPEGSPLRGFSTLEEVSEWVANTVLIPLDETRTKPVFGVGNPNADLLVIGEAPGRDEDLQGEPFVGRAGKLLDDILAAIDFDRKENVYIANILKSRPPNNRNPEASEVIAHLPILHKQIALIRPKIILCVGKTAGTSLLNLDSTLGAMRGTFHDYHGLPVLVTYHPAALLRNPNWKRPTWEDVKLLRRRYEELTSDSPDSDG